MEGNELDPLFVAQSIIGSHQLGAVVGHGFAAHTQCLGRGGKGLARARWAIKYKIGWRHIVCNSGYGSCQRIASR